MKILAISASPRKNRMTHNAIKEILKDVKSEYEIISLAGKRVNGCIGCTACALENTCKVRDDWNEIGEKMKEADIIIFGAPNYYGMLNAIAHATLERTFAFRHRGTYTLKDKLGVAIGTRSKNKDENPVLNHIEKMFNANKMKTVAKMEVGMYNQCYTCGYGHECADGAVAGKHGLLKEILPCHLPKEVEEQEDTLLEIANVREVLKANGVEFN